MSHESNGATKQTATSPTYEIFTKNSKEKEVQTSPKDIHVIKQGSEKNKRHKYYRQYSANPDILFTRIYCYAFLQTRLKDNNERPCYLIMRT